MQYQLTNLVEAGIDEAGKGPLLGSVFAAAVILDPTIPLSPLLRDSKKLSRKKRALARTWIEANARSYAIGWSSEETIDLENIRNATFHAMHKALDQLDTTPEYLLVDGNCFQEYSGIPHKCIVKGDDSFANIMCASILAKEAHDDYIKDLVATYPSLQERYNLLANMGYGTRDHMLGLNRYGPTIFHRQSFAPVTRVLPLLDLEFHRNKPLLLKEFAD